MTLPLLPEPPRIAYLESIRGLAAVQVVLLHFLGAFMPDLVFEPVSRGVASYIHLSPLYFLYDGHSAVYIFFVLSGYVLTRSFERHLDSPAALVAARIIRLGLPAIAAVLVAAAAIMVFGMPNVEAGAATGSAWFANPRLAELSALAILRDGVVNAIFLGYRGLPGVGFLSPWQQSLDHSFAAPLWTLSIELYGSLAVLLLCWCARRSRVLWWSAAVIVAIFTLRSAYLCFVVGHLLASWRRAEHPAPPRPLLPLMAVALGVFLCVRAEVWQPDWLRTLCSDPMPWLFPGQSAAQQQKTYGAILLLTGLIHLRPVRTALSTPWLVRQSRLSFPIYVVHWPVLFGPAALLFLWLDGAVGPELARLGAIVAGIALAFGAGLLFLPIDRGALVLSRLTRERLFGMRTAAKTVSPVAATRAMATE